MAGEGAGVGKGGPVSDERNLSDANAAALIAALGAAGGLLAANNLSELTATQATARANIGAGVGTVTGVTDTSLVLTGSTLGLGLTIPTARTFSALLTASAGITISTVGLTISAGGAAITGQSTFTGAATTDVPVTVSVIAAQTASALTISLGAGLTSSAPMLTITANTATSKTGTYITVINTANVVLFSVGQSGNSQFTTAGAGSTPLTITNNAASPSAPALVVAHGTTPSVPWLTLTNVQTSTAVGAAGGATALPATPTGYVFFVLNGSTFRFPYYA